MKCDEIFAALAMLEKERGIPQSFMMGKIIQALTTAYKRDHEGVEYVVVDVDEEKKDLKMYVQKEIVEEVENPASQISLEDAKRISAKNELGGMVILPSSGIASLLMSFSDNVSIVNLLNLVPSSLVPSVTCVPYPLRLSALFPSRTSNSPRRVPPALPPVVGGQQVVPDE